MRRTFKPSLLTSMEASKSTRFGQNTLIPVDSEVCCMSGLYDMAGNRSFTSNSQGYWNNKNELARAELLVSDEGEKFLKRNMGILRKLDRALVKITEQFEPGSFCTPIKELKIDESSTLTRLASGGQSEAFTLTTETEKYVLQKKSPKNPHLGNVSQPYINEMLQIQMISRDIGAELAENNFYLPDFLFATSQISFAKFIEGAEPCELDLLECSDALVLLDRYVLGRRESEDPLWSGIATDMLYGNSFKTDNFIKTPDGRIVFIDPLFYSKQN